MDGYVHLHQVLFQCQGEHTADLDGVLATNSELANVLPGNAATWAHLEVRTQKSKKNFLSWMMTDGSAFQRTGTKWDLFSVYCVKMERRIQIRKGKRKKFKSNRRSFDWNLR